MTPKETQLPNLADDKRKFSYKSLMFADNGGMYLQRFDCIVGKPVTFKNTEVVPVIHLSLPDVDGNQFPTVDEHGKVKTSVRDKEWHARITESQNELDQILDSFAETLVSAV